MHFKFFIYCGLLISGLTYVQGSVEKITLKSPDGKLLYSLQSEDGKTTQSLKKQNKTILERGCLGLIVDGKNLAEGVKSWKSKDVARNKEEKFSILGGKKLNKVIYNEYNVEGIGSDLRLNVRVYSNGVAFRYVWPESLKDKTTVKVEDENCEFRFPEKSILWTQDSPAALDSCEGSWSSSQMKDFKPDEKNPRSYIRTAPITAELPDNAGYALIQEAGNFGLDWSGIKFALRDGACRTVYYHDSKGFSVVPKNNQPWRVVLHANDLNELVNNDIIPSLAPAPDKSIFPEGINTSWIKPGRSSWTWWDKLSAKYDDQYKFVDMSSDFGFENHLVDEGWKKWDTDLSICIDKLKKLVEYSDKKKVGIWVWVDWGDLKDPQNNWEKMRTFLDKMQEIGVRGLKVDFMRSASQDRLKFYDALLKKSAKKHLMLNLHGANIPGGEARTWPHEVTREAIFGLERNLGGEVSGTHYCALPFTRMISGQGDFTGGYFGHSKRLRGSSWALQMASNIIFTSPLLNWVSNPEDMEACFPKGSPERCLISAIPPIWDETFVLPGAKIGNYAPFARRKGNQWFIALMNGDNGTRTAMISLDFLPEGKFSLVTLSDLSDKNDGWKVEKKEVTRKNKLDFTMRSRGGGIAWLVPTS